MTPLGSLPNATQQTSGTQRSVLQKNLAFHRAADEALLPQCLGVEVSVIEQHHIANTVGVLMSTEL